jgi:hypothetical protein
MEPVRKDNYTVRVTGTTAAELGAEQGGVITAVPGAPSTNQVDHSWADDITPGQGDTQPKPCGRIPPQKTQNTRNEIEIIKESIEEAPIVARRSVQV